MVELELKEMSDEIRAHKMEELQNAREEELTQILVNRIRIYEIGQQEE